MFEVKMIDLKKLVNKRDVECDFKNNTAFWIMLDDYQIKSFMRIIVVLDVKIKITYTHKDGSAYYDNIKYFSQSITEDKSDLPHETIILLSLLDENRCD